MAQYFKTAILTSKAIDIDANEEFIYIGALNEQDNVVIIKLPAALDTDGTISYLGAGSGTEIGVICGRYEAALAYGFGELGSNIKIVMQSDIDGSYWFQEDPGTWAGSARIVVDHEDDYFVIAYATEDDILRENFGNYFYFSWTDLIGTVSIDIFSIEKSPVFPDDIFMGLDSNDPYWYSGADIVRFSANGGYSIVSSSNNLLGQNLGTVTSIEFS